MSRCMLSGMRTICWMKPFYNMRLRMAEVLERRWGPVYEFSELKKTISDIRDNVFDGFYLNEEEDDIPDGLCQGDVIEGDLPFIWVDENGGIRARRYAWWVVLSNTCDISNGKLKYIALAPVERMRREEDASERFTRYTIFHNFYLPPWGEVTGDVMMVVDLRLTTHVSADTRLIDARRASMGRDAWYLFHCCLVRFLARDDGRRDVG